MKQLLTIMLIVISFTSCIEDRVEEGFEESIEEGVVDYRMRFPLSKIEFIDVGGYSLNVKSRGKGSRTIVFECGLGDNMNEWILESPLFNTLARDHQIIIYNRAGYPPSEEAPDSVARNVTQLAVELETVIEEVATNNEVILIGHSFGGLIVRKYADLYPDRVAGILFLDPTHEDDLDRDMLQALEDSQVFFFESVGLSFLAAEFKQLVENYDIVSALGNLPDIPVRVITSMIPDEFDGETDADMENKSAAHKTLEEGVSDFKHIETTMSGHHIHHTESDLVISTLNEII